MKIGVLGAGAMGQLFGAYLMARGHDVVLIDVSAATCTSINERGIRVMMGPREVYGKPRAVLVDDVDHELELVLVLTKSPQTCEALSSATHLFSEGTIGLSLQNGLGNEVPLIEYFGADHTVIGMTDFPADRRKDGEIFSDPTGHVVVGEVISGGREKAQAVASLLDDAGLNAAYTEDVRVPIWEKVIFNTVFNTISAATGLRTGEVFGIPEASVLANAVLEEALLVAQREKIPIDRTRLYDSVMNAHNNHADHKPSMLVDLESGRQTEIETIGGAVERAGERNGVATPHLSTLCSIIRLRERSRPR